MCFYSGCLCENSNVCVFSLFQEVRPMLNQSQVGALQLSLAEPHYNFSIRRWLKSGVTGESETLQPIGAFLIIPFGSRRNYEWETIMNGPCKWTAAPTENGALNFFCCWRNAWFEYSKRWNIVVYKTLQKSCVLLVHKQQHLSVYHLFCTWSFKRNLGLSCGASSPLKD